MKTLTLSLLALVWLAAPRLTAQTTGVPTVNDLAILLPPSYTPAGSGLASCALGTNQGYIPGAPFTVAYQVSALTSTTAILLLDFFNPCASPGFAFFPSQPVSCAGPVASGTNLWYALGFSPFPVTVVGIPNPGALTRWNFTVPTGPGQVWAQVFLLDTCSSTGFKFSQALGFNW